MAPSYTLQCEQATSFDKMELCKMYRSNPVFTSMQAPSFEPRMEDDTHFELTGYSAEVRSSTK